MERIDTDRDQNDKKTLLMAIVALCTGIASADIKLLSKVKGIVTICIEGYVVVRSGGTLFQLLDSDGDPLTCKGEAHKLINR